VKPFIRIPVFVTAVLAFLLAAMPTSAIDTNSTVRPGGFQFDGKISRPVLENYLSRSICIEGIHFGQVEIMNRNDHGNTNWFRLITLVRDYAAKHARRHMVICNGHVPTGGLMRDGNPILDFHAFPLRIKETPEKPQEAILQLGFSDGIYNRSKGGKTFSGWTCEHLPYIVELDNYGRSNHPGQPNAQGGNFLWIWGYDEITWFGLQSREYRVKWLQYAWDWVRKTDTNGYLEMPGGRTASSAEMRWYFANNPSDACPTGRGDESAIRAVWASNTAKLSN
jgi:hypothetical protein